MRRTVIEGALVATLLVCVIAYGVFLRLEDPLSTEALAAEDPWTHVVFTKEWQRQGYFADSFHMGTEMYPPGMHAWLVAFVPFTGIDLHTFARLAPAFFGGLAILGMFALGKRLGGPMAGAAAAFVTAVMPEHIFRTELLFPTSLDLALLPFWILSFHDALHGDRRAIAVFALSTVPLAVMHPWAVPLVGVPLATYAALRAFREAVPRKAIWIGAGLLVPAVAFSMAFRWDESDTGFSDFLAQLPGLGWLETTPLSFTSVFFGVVVLLGALAALLGWTAQHVPALPRIAGIALGALLLGAIPFLTRALPPDVDYLSMLGPVALGFAACGILVALVWPSAVGDLAISLCVWLFPLTAVNIFHSPFWPQRTVVYLGVGIALLAAATLAPTPALIARLAGKPRARATVGIAALIALALVFAGTAYATPPDTYRWYRLYGDKEFAGFERVGAILEEDAQARIFVYTWQPALLVKAVSAPEHVWYGPKFFTSEGSRETQMGQVHGPAYVLVEKHTRRAGEQGKLDLGFLEDAESYPLVFETEGGALQLYKVRT